MNRAGVEGVTYPVRDQNRISIRKIAALAKGSAVRNSEGIRNPEAATGTVLEPNLPDIGAFLGLPTCCSFWHLATSRREGPLKAKLQTELPEESVRLQSLVITRVVTLASVKTMEIRNVGIARLAPAVRHHRNAVQHQSPGSRSAPWVFA